MRKKTDYLFVCGPGLWGYLPFSLQWICASFQGLFAFLMEILSFLFLSKKKKRDLVYLPSALLPSHMSTAPQGHILLQSFFAAWLFSEQIWNCCSCGFSKLTNCVMVLKKKSKCIVALSFFNKGKLWKENRQHQQIICGQVLNYIYTYTHIYIYINKSSSHCHLIERK